MLTFFRLEDRKRLCEDLAKLPASSKESYLRHEHPTVYLDLLWFCGKSDDLEIWPIKEDLTPYNYSWYIQGDILAPLNFARARGKLKQGQTMTVKIYSSLYHYTGEVDHEDKASGFGVAISKGSALGSRKYKGLFFNNEPIICSEEYSGGWFASTSEFKDGKMFGKMTLYEGGNKVTNHIYKDGKVLSKLQVRHR